MRDPLQLVGTLFAALLGLVFGSFLNVVVARLPEGESIVAPGSHCRNCSHILSWWENLPVLSWIVLRGRCRSCHAAISVRYPLVELAVAALWTSIWLLFSSPLFPSEASPQHATHTWIILIGYALLTWLLTALAALDAEYFWLPDLLTVPGILLGFAFTVAEAISRRQYDLGANIPQAIRDSLEAILISGLVILAIRLLYWLIRRREGMGLGDAKLMAMLGAWLGLAGAMEIFVVAILGACLAALLWLLVIALKRSQEAWAKMPLPLGTFLSIAAMSEVFYPDWLWTWYSRAFLHF